MTKYLTAGYHTFANQVIEAASQMCYNIDDLLTVCPDLDIPIVVDYHHDWINVRYFLLVPTLN